MQIAKAHNAKRLSRRFVRDTKVVLHLANCVRFKMTSREATPKAMTRRQVADHTILIANPEY